MGAVGNDPGVGVFSCRQTLQSFSPDRFIHFQVNQHQRHIVGLCGLHKSFSGGSADRFQSTGFGSGFNAGHEEQVTGQDQYGFFIGHRLGREMVRPPPP